MNPYDWSRHDPAVEIPRPEVTSVIELLRGGNGGVLLAGRGMGKTILLRQLRRLLENLPDVKVVEFPEPPPELTVQACFAALARELEVPVEGAIGARDLVRTYRQRDVPKNLVLLFDELDSYARVLDGPRDAHPGRHFFNSLESMRRDFKGVGILAVGHVGVFVLRDALGSPFMSRATTIRLRPFSRDEVETLARPFAERGSALPGETLDALYLASGGHPALATYGLESLWSHPRPDERAVTEAFAGFQDRNREFLRDFERSFANPQLSEAPRRVWELIQRSDGSVARADLQRACGDGEQLLRLDVADVLGLLQAAGLVHLVGSMRTDPVYLRPINSILSLPTVAAPARDLREQLRLDLHALLLRLHVSSADFFRPGSNGRGKRLVPESVFSAFLALGLELLGWRVDREAQRGAGRTDVLLRRQGTGELAIVEVKIWQRRGYKTAQRQLEGYWGADTAAGAVVMLTDAEIDAWPERYRQECLAAYETVHAIDPEGGAPIRAQLGVVSRAKNGLEVETVHFLLGLARSR